MEKIKKHKTTDGVKKLKLKFRTDLNKSVIIENFEERNWEESQEEDHWNFYWASVNTTIKLCGLKSTYILKDTQIVCHFPNFYELTKKDNMAKNIKNYRKQQQQLKDPVIDEALNFLPMTYLLPIELNPFIEEFKRDPKALWILKPSNKSQGQGITLVNKSSKVKKMTFISKLMDDSDSDSNNNTSYVISKYIKNPLLVGHKKFDMRIYCLVTSFHPIKAYLFQLGFCRFCNEKFSIDVNDIDNIYIHLTNVAIQKKYEKYSASHGGKWSLKNLRFYLENNYGYDKTKKCFDDIKNVIINSLKSVESVMNGDKHCFECYGYDILLDENLKPWLIEINSSPSLSTTTKGDHILKKKLINDVLDIVVTDKWHETKGKVGVNSFTGNKCGFFDVIYDGAVNDKKEKNTKIVLTSKAKRVKSN